MWVRCPVPISQALGAEVHEVEIVVKVVLRGLTNVGHVIREIVDKVIDIVNHLHVGLCQIRLEGVFAAVSWKIIQLNTLFRTNKGKKKPQLY